MKGDTGLLKVSWNNHSGALINSLNNCLLRESYCDATLICDSKQIRVHRLVLATCSSYFKEIFDSILCAQPFIVLKDIGLLELEALVDYMYKGKATICENRLPKLIKAADYLKIKGLAEADDEASLPVKISSRDNTQSDVPISSLVIDENPPTLEIKLKGKLKSTKAKSIKRKSDGDSLNENRFKPTATAKAKKQKTIQKHSNRGPNIMTRSEKRQETQNVETTVTTVQSNYKPVSSVESVIKLQYLPNEETESSEMATNENVSPENNSHFVSEKDVTSPNGFLSALSDSYPSQRNISDNLNENLPDVDQDYPHKCPDCTFRAKYPSGLVTHRKTHTGVFTKPFKCGYCEFSSYKKMLLQEHMKCHKDAKPFKCKKCIFRASLNISLKKHEEICMGKSTKISESYVNSVTANYEDGPSQLPLEDEDVNITSQIPQNTAENVTSLSIDNTASSSNISVDFLDNRASCSSPRLGGMTMKKRCLPRGLLKTDYFICFFCPFKTNDEGRLASHVASNHSDS